MLNSIKLFIIKTIKFEYWPWWFFYIPLSPYFLYLAYKAKSLTFFTAVNPDLKHGGFFGYSKYQYLHPLKSEYLPKTVYCLNDISAEKLKELLKSNEIEFPCIAKPDIGERGNLVELIKNFTELENYSKKCSENWMIQEYVAYPLEFGIFYCFLPLSNKPIITSLTSKEFMHVKGDGKKTILELMKQNSRYAYQIQRLKTQNKINQQEVPLKDEIILLEPIGNHCRGTKFINSNELISEKLVQTISKIVEPLPNFYYGRIDLKATSFENLENGKDIKIIEINGANSEPTHIYDPNYSLIKAYKDLFTHWKLMADICIANISKGVKTSNATEFLNEITGHVQKRKKRA